jgi:thioredoxin reductase
MSTNDLPVAVIGAGPVGLAAAAHLITRNVPVKVYEAGDTIAANVRDWGHVRLFSPWSFNADNAAKAILRRNGWQEPPGDSLPTGHDLYDAYLRPLADTPEFSAVIETKAKVGAITRHGIGKVVTPGRADRPFSLVVQNSATRIDLARAVIDASGTWQNPNPLGASGLPALGEADAAELVTYGIPDVLRSDRATYAGKRVLVIGGGHSAANVLLDLARLAETDRTVQMTWAVRSQNLSRVFGGGDADRLPARGKLGSDLKLLAGSSRLHLITGLSAERVSMQDGSIIVTGRTSAGPAVLGPFDRIIVATGQRPDLALTRELRLDLDPWLECSRALGPAIDPNLHSCGSVPPHGYRELAHPEPGYFAVGAKSYGRAPTFLMATGYEQVRSIAAFLSGDHKAADDVRLVLPETGVCSTNLAAQNETEKSGCCGSPASAEIDACCTDDADAKAAGAAGCGCSSGAAKPVAVTEAASRSACCA